MKKYPITAMANNLVFEQTLYAESEQYAPAHIGENVMLLNIKDHPIKIGFWSKIKKLFVT